MQPGGGAGGVSHSVSKTRIVVESGGQSECQSESQSDMNGEGSESQSDMKGRVCMIDRECVSD